MEGWEPFVVRKDAQVPNEGREASSFLWAMRKLHRDARPADVFAFVQGNPFPHCADLLAQLRRPVRGFRWLGDLHETREDGGPHHPGLPVGEKHREWTGRPWPGVVWFAAGGQFTLTGRELRRHKPAFYRKLQRQMSQGEMPWVAERLWGEIFAWEGAGCRNR